MRPRHGQRSLDLGFGAQVLLELPHFGLQHLLRNLGFDVFKFGQLGFWPGFVGLILQS
jgi:hypothetical protein